jgi:hypothetical protein
VIRVHKFWADFLVVIHLGYVGFVIFGLLAILVGLLLRWQWVRNPWFRWIHLVMICIVAAEAVVDFECPLTTWENQLRRQDRAMEILLPRAAFWTPLLGSALGDGPLMASSSIWETWISWHSETFVGRCLDQIMFPKLPPWAFTPIYIGFAVVVLATVLLAPPRRRKAAQGAARAR